MRWPVWFHVSRFGRIPVQWTPIAWQDWAIVGALTAAILALLPLARTQSGMVTLYVCLLVAAVIGVAALTDDSHSPVGKVKYLPDNRGRLLITKQSHNYITPQRPPEKGGLFYWEETAGEAVHKVATAASAARGRPLQFQVAPEGKLSVDIRVYNDGGFDYFYNVYWDRLLILPGAIALYDAQRHYVRDMVQFMAGSQVTAGPEVQTHGHRSRHLVMQGQRYSAGLCRFIQAPITCR